MKKIIALAGVLVLIGATAIVLNQPKNNNNHSQNGTQNATDSSAKTANPATPNQQSAQAETSTINIENFAFSPASVSVEKGTTVTWTNKDSAPHTVTEADNQEGPQSGTLEKGQTYQFTFTKSGVFKYHCTFHSSMVATINVTE